MDLVDRHDAEIPLNVQAHLLTVSRRSLYYRPAPPSATEVAIKHAIDRSYTEQPAYGSRRIAVIWALDDTLEQPFVLDAVSQALTRARPQIWNSDQGSHFTSP